MAESLREQIGFALCPDDYVDFECCGRCIHYRGDKKCYNPRINQIHSLVIEGVKEIENPFNYADECREFMAYSKAIQAVKRGLQSARK